MLLRRFTQFSAFADGLASGGLGFQGCGVEVFGFAGGGFGGFAALELLKFAFTVGVDEAGHGLDIDI